MIANHRKWYIFLLTYNILRNKFNCLIIIDNIERKSNEISIILLRNKNKNLKVKYIIIW